MQKTPQIFGTLLKMARYIKSIYQRGMQHEQGFLAFFMAFHRRIGTVR